MDDKEFKRKLSEVANWIIPDDLSDLIERPRKTIRKKKPKKVQVQKPVDSDQDIEDLEEQEEFVHSDEPNDTYPPKILDLKCQGTVCDDCGRYCENGRKKEKKLYELNNKRHWREKCITCNKARNPYTGYFDLSTGQSGIVWNGYIHNRKQRVETKPKIPKEPKVKKTKPVKPKIEIIALQTIENDDSIITFYGEKITNDK